ncbi:hypothetical protein BKA70DRAFT_42396 [Coprinopsis sp. MPI-PUGE-AT-0042]|nr:hypothetical protein BKA70DRAFT_42396 [Coprinopsis sp. MPI-PUGE-AT-0042]
MTSKPETDPSDVPTLKKTWSSHGLLPTDRVHSSAVGYEAESSTHSPPAVHPSNTRTLSNDLLSLPACQAINVNGGSFATIGRDSINYHYNYHLLASERDAPPAQCTQHDRSSFALWGVSMACLLISFFVIVVLAIYMQAFISISDRNQCSC